MDSKEFKNIFNEISVKYGFEKAFGGWFKESPECIIALDLQKSKYSDYYQLIIKIFIHGLFGKTYSKSKDLVKKDVGNIFTGEPKEYKDIFDFDNYMDENKRKEKLIILFEKFLVPITNSALTKDGIKKLYDKEELFLLPAVKKELGIS
jgi:hypothetical protein